MINSNQGQSESEVNSEYSLCSSDDLNKTVIDYKNIKKEISNKKKIVNLKI